MNISLVLAFSLVVSRSATVEHLFDLTGDFRSPSDVAVSSSGTVYVVDGLNNCVKSFDADGKAIGKFGVKGNGDGQFNRPLGITVGASGRVYVADSGNHRIQIFGSNAAFIAKLDLPPRNNKPADPTDLAVDEAGDACHIVDNDNHRILHYELASRKLRQIIGTPGTKKREFHFPFSIAQTRSHDLCVVDVLNTRVQVLNPEGLFVNFIGDWGVDKGEFYRPKGIAVDAQDRVYVSDSYLGVIQVFKAGGSYLDVLTDARTNEVKKFVTPVGLWIDVQGRLYVVEMTQNRVGVFRLNDETKP